MTRRNQFFKQYFDHSADPDGETLLKSIRNDFKEMKPIRKKSCISSWFRLRRDNYSRMIMKSQSSVAKELDLRKFIYR